MSTYWIIEQYQILTGDATCRTILVLDKLNNTQTTRKIRAREGEAVSVSCEMYGWLPEGID